MENKLTRIVTILTVIGLMSFGTVAYAASQETAPQQDTGVSEPVPGEEGPEGGAGSHRGKGPKKFFKDLNLTPEQQEKLDAHRKAQRAKNKETREQLKTKMQALHEEISKPNMDRAQLNGLVAEVNTLKGHLFSQHIEGVLEMKEVLTPEQFAKMQEHFKKGGPGKHGGWGKHGRGPEGEPSEPSMEKE